LLESEPTDEPVTDDPNPATAKGQSGARPKQSTKEGNAENGVANGRHRVPELSFEGAIERLTEIVEQLEAEGQPLDTSLKLFEEGIRLARESQTRLESAEKKVEELLAYDDDGRPIVDDLDTD
jgi:exodeoxyribonuclease VII small subunit